MIHYLKICILACLLLWALPVQAGSGLPESLEIEAHHSRLIKTHRPIIRASVADPKIADVKVLTPTQVLVVSTSKDPGTTSLIIWYSEQEVEALEIKVYTLVPHWIVQAMKQRLAEIAPAVNIQVTPARTVPREETLILTGSVRSQETLNQVLTLVESFGIKFYNLIRLDGPQQVQLNVVIAEVSKSGLKQMGVNFMKLNDALTWGVFKGGSVEAAVTVGNETEMTMKNTLDSPFSSAFQVALSSVSHNWLGLISLLKNQGLARTLATPTLVTLNGQQAQFQVGGEYPIPVSGENGTTNIEHKSYGIMLEFTPYILDQDLITLSVSPEVSTPDFSLGVTAGGATVPGLTTRRATTTLQLRAGQTFAMAGLLKEEFFRTVNKVPFLGDIPVLGTLFTSKENQYQETELVVMVTPRIVRPMEPDEVPELPGHGISPSIDDSSFYIMNRLDPTEKSGTDLPPEFKGKTGFTR